MNNELTNLLPPERQRALARNYYLRLGVVGVVLVNILVLASAVMLIPTYVFLMKSAAAKETRLAIVESALSSANEKEISARLTALTANATILTTLSTTPSVSVVVRSILGVARPGVTLSNFVYTPGAKKKSGTLTISGIAATRDALRNYQLALQSTPSILSATLPVSAYAKDTNIDFSIALTISP